MAAGARRRRPLRRRRRARGAAPPLRALLAQGAVRPRPRVDARAVPAPLQPGLHPGATRSPTSAASTSRRREVEERDGAFFHGDAEVDREYGKMGKSLKNVVTPDDIYRDYGADTLRLYEMFMGPLDASRPWSTGDIIGVHRFLQRLWRNVVDEETGEPRVTAEPGRRRDPPAAAPHDRRGRAPTWPTLEFNTAIAAALRAQQPADPGRGRAGRARREEVVDAAGADARAARAARRRGAVGAARPRRVARVRPTSPSADPHVARRSTPSRSPVQVNGKVRARVTVAAGADEAATEAAARADARVAALLDGATVRKVVVVPGPPGQLRRRLARRSCGRGACRPRRGPRSRTSPRSTVDAGARRRGARGSRPGSRR